MIGGGEPLIYALLTLGYRVAMCGWVVSAVQLR